MESELHYLVYVSRQSYPLTRRELREIMDQAVNFNRQHQITGMLVYRAGSFLQVLEGSKPVITQLFDRIRTDSRHSHVELIIVEPATQRYFAEWSMGFCEFASDEDRELSAYTTFLREGLVARLKPFSPSIPASLLTMFSYGYTNTHEVYH